MYHLPKTGGLFSESVATNFLLEKLNKAGIETIIDKVAYENMFAYVKEVNISLEMLEADLYPVQMMEEKELSDYHTENILQLARSKEFLQVKDNLFGDKSQAASKDLSCITFRKREGILATRTSCYAIFLNLHKLHKSNR